MSEVKTTSQEIVLGALRSMIASGQLTPGQQVRQEALAADLGVSRVPLREALKVLEGEGHVVYHPHRGYFVAELSVDDLVEVYRIRALLEDEALRVGVPQATDAEIAELTNVMHQIEKATQDNDVAAISKLNREFHFSMFALCRMPRLVRLITNTWDATEAYRAVFFTNNKNHSAMNHEHGQIIDALVKRDVNGVIAAQHAHREGSVQAVSQLIS